MTPPNASPHVDIDLRVRYAETDRKGVAHHSVHLVWFEMGRTEFCRAAGFSYADLERLENIYLVVAEARCRYKAPVTYDDPIRVRTRLDPVSARLLRFRYEVFHLGPDRLVAEGETTHVPVDRAGRRTTVPAPYATMLAAWCRPADTH